MKIRIMKDNMLQLPILIQKVKLLLVRLPLDRNSRSSMSIKLDPPKLMEPTKTEISISIDHSTFDPDCGCKELSVLPEERILLFNPKEKEQKNNSGDLIKFLRPLSL